ncbi:MAG: hypothetical protein QXZ12_04565 [Thermoplasmata archaeon]
MSIDSSYSADYRELMEKFKNTDKEMYNKMEWLFIRYYDYTKTDVDIKIKELEFEISKKYNVIIEFDRSTLN